MEDTLRDTEEYVYSENIKVLILVLMEDTLRANIKLTLMKYIIRS